MKNSILLVRPIFSRHKDRTIGLAFISTITHKITRPMELALEATLGTTETGGCNQRKYSGGLSSICLLKYTIGSQKLTALLKTDVRETEILGTLKIALSPPGYCSK